MLEEFKDIAPSLFSVLLHDEDNAVQSALKCTLGTYGLSVASARARLQTASELISTLKIMSIQVFEYPTLQTAWHLLTAVAAHALDFDLRVLTLEESLPLAQVLKL